MTRLTLADFRTWAFKKPKKKAARGKKKRGHSEQIPNKRRAPITVNGDLRVAGSLLRYLIGVGFLPHLHLDDLVFCLEAFEVGFEFPEFLRRKEIATVLRAAIRHDQAVFKLTREEKSQLGERVDSESGSTPRYVAIAPFVAVSFLAGMRLDELCLIEWRRHVDLMYRDFDGKVIGQIQLFAEDTKTHRARFVSFDVSPMLRELMVALKKVRAKGSVFDVTYDEAQAASQRLRDPIKGFGCPDNFTYQMARSTCSTYLVNAPGIYGSAASFHSAKQLGHSQVVQEKHYAGLIKGISKEIKTLEAAMQIEPELRYIIDTVLGRNPAPLPPLPVDDEDEVDDSYDADAA